MTSWGPSQGGRIRQAREALALSQEELGRQVGLNGAVLYYFESGTIDPGPLLERIAAVFNLPLEWFRGQSEREADSPGHEEARAALGKSPSQPLVEMPGEDPDRSRVVDGAESTRPADVLEAVLATHADPVDHPALENAARMPTETFTVALQRAIDQAGSIRELGELLSPEDPDKGERMLRRWRRASKEKGALPPEPGLRLLTQRTGIDFMPFAISYATLLARYLETVRRLELLRLRNLALSESVAALRAREARSSEPRFPSLRWRPIFERLRDIRKNI